MEIIMAEESQNRLIDLTQDLSELSRITAGSDNVDSLIRCGLDWLARLVRYELATVFELDGQVLRVRVARGLLANQQVRNHVLSMDRFPSVKDIIQTRQARTFTEDDHQHGDGDPFDGVLELPAGHSCMVVPLCVGDRCLGVLSLDSRECGVYPPEVVNLVEVYGQILALSMQTARQNTTLERLRQQAEEREKILRADLGWESEIVLEKSRSAVMRELSGKARQVAVTDTPVLILGETGTGKERLARAIHLWSNRAEHPFVTINCVAIPANLMESELFGHVKGAFTGATRDRAGRFQMANGGTLLLDEIGELPLELQAKLLRVLQEGTFEPVGSDRTVKVNVRILAATNLDLERAVKEKRFREDLFYRLSVFPLRLPPLRERLEDLPLLCKTLLAELRQRTGKAGLEVTPEGLEKLAQYQWPGNIRELSNILERAAILARGVNLEPEAIDIPIAGNGNEDELDFYSTAHPHKLMPVPSLDDIQKMHIERVLQMTGGRVYGKNGAASQLRIKPSTLQSRMKKLGVERPNQKEVEDGETVEPHFPEFQDKPKSQSSMLGEAVPSALQPVKPLPPAQPTPPAKPAEAAKPMQLVKPPQAAQTTPPAKPKEPVFPKTQPPAPTKPVETKPAAEKPRLEEIPPAPESVQEEKPQVPGRYGPIRIFGNQDPPRRFTRIFR